MYVYLILSLLCLCLEQTNTTIIHSSNSTHLETTLETALENHLLFSPLKLYNSSRNLGLDREHHDSSSRLLSFMASHPTSQNSSSLTPKLELAFDPKDLNAQTEQTSERYCTLGTQLRPDQGLAGTLQNTIAELTKSLQYPIGETFCFIPNDRTNSRYPTGVTILSYPTLTKA